MTAGLANQQTYDHENSHVYMFNLLAKYVWCASHTRVKYTHSICWAYIFINIHPSCTQTGVEIAAHECQRYIAMSQPQISVGTPLNAALFSVQQALQIKR